MQSLDKKAWTSVIDLAMTLSTLFYSSYYFKTRRNTKVTPDRPAVVGMGFNRRLKNKIWEPPSLAFYSGKKFVYSSFELHVLQH